LWLERVPRVLTIDKEELKAMRTWRLLALAAVLTNWRDDWNRVLSRHGQGIPL